MRQTHIRCNIAYTRSQGGGNTARFELVEFGWKVLSRCRCRGMIYRFAFRAISSYKEYFTMKRNN